MRSIRAMDIKRHVGRNLARFRKEKGLTQEDLAFECELDRTYISGIERGVRNPTILIIQKIAKALGLAPHKLLE
jgi:transcriptional regulator with XRE-family HTH domain